MKHKCFVIFVMLLITVPMLNVASVESSDSVNGDAAGFSEDLDGVDAYNSGEDAFKQKQYEAAIAYFTEALSREITNNMKVWAYFYRGKAYYNVADDRKAISDLSKVIKPYPDWAEALYYRGNAYTATGSYSLAENDYERAIKVLQGGNESIKGADFAAWLGNMATSANNQDHSRNLAILSSAYFGLGGVHAIQGAWDKAAEDFFHCIAIDPKKKAAYLHRGEAYLKAAAYIKAVEDFNKAVALGENSEDVYMGRGEAYYRLGKYDWAKADMDRVLAFNPKNAKAWFVRGYIDEKQYNWQEGINDYTRAIESNPKASTAYFRRSVCYAMAKNRDAAMKDVSYAITLNPNYAEAYYLRAQLYMIGGEPEAAEREYKKYNEVLNANQQAANKEFMERMALISQLYGLSPYAY